jgi:hypothetical protein
MHTRRRRLDGNVMAFVSVISMFVIAYSAMLFGCASSGLRTIN